MKITNLTLMGSLASLFLSISSSASVLTQCNTCNTSASYESTAKYVASTQTSNVNEVFIANFESNTLNKYRVVHLISREPGVSDTVEIVQLALSSSESNAFENASSARASMKSAKPDIPKEVAPSAYSLAGASYVLNNVSDHFTNQAGFEDQMTAYTASLGQISGTITNVPVVFELDFSDGSVGLFKITPTIGATVALTIVQLKDKDNNTIPLNPAGYKTGSFDFTEQGPVGVENFIDAAARFGVTITSGGGSGSGGGLEMSCEQKSSGTYICTLITH